MKRFLWILWELPQWLLGLIIRLVTGAKREIYFNGVPVYVSPKMIGGIALGEMIILNEACLYYRFERTVKHEYGHVRQSRMFGPLYLIVIGLPSITFNIMTILGWLAPETYYKRYPENWADKLGGVDRTRKSPLL